MKKINNKKAIILVYVLFLVMITITLSTIMLTSINTLFNISTLEDYKYRLLSNIKNDWKILIKINESYNSNGTWFIDSTTWSWLNIHCRDNWTWLYEVRGDDWIKPWTDNLDDNCNSDNYKVTSTWTTATWFYYPNNFSDDDVIWRLNLIGFVWWDKTYKKIFFNSEKYKKIISENINNNDYLHNKIWDVTEWYLYLNIDKSIHMRLVEFDKNIYDNSNELVPLNIFTWSINNWSGFISKTWSILKLDSSKTNWLKFDFKNKLYSIFLKSDETVLYKLSSQTDTWTWIYITPINDSFSWKVEYLWNEIIIWENSWFIGMEKKLFYQK